MPSKSPYCPKHGFHKGDVVTRGEACNGESPACALTENSSKAEEIAHWQAFLATLPANSYLALYFQGSTEFLENAMRNDMAIEGARDLNNRRLLALGECLDAEKRLKQLTEQRDTLEAAVRRLKREASQIRDALEDASRTSSSTAAQAAGGFGQATAILKKIEQI